MASLFCPECGYNVSYQKAGADLYAACPECGQRFMPDALASRQQKETITQGGVLRHLLIPAAVVAAICAIPILSLYALFVIVPGYVILGGVSGWMLSRRLRCTRAVRSDAGSVEECGAVWPLFLGFWALHLVLGFVAIFGGCFASFFILDAFGGLGIH